MQPQAATEKSTTVRWHPDLLGRLCELISRETKPEEQTRECGGLLLGTVQRIGSGVQIIVRLFTPISCSYQEGRFYHLSEADKSSLQQSMASYVSPYWCCVGFYRSHCRPGLELDENDLRLTREHLRDLPSIFLLLAADGSHGGLFLFDGLEFSKDPGFVLPSSPSAGRDAFAPELSQRPSGGISPLPGSDHGDPVPQGLAALGRQLQVPSEPARTKASAQLSDFVGRLAKTGMPGWLTCTLILLVGGLVVVWNGGEPQSNREIKNSAPSKSSFGLVTSLQRDQMHIAWNPHAPSIARASSGTLVVTEGRNHTTIPLDKDLLTYGSVVYYPTHDVVTFQLRIGDLTELLVAAGIDKSDAGQPLPARSDEQERVRQRLEDTPISTGAAKGTTLSQTVRNTRPQLDQRSVSPLVRDSASEPIRTNYEAPPPSLSSALPAPERLQPLDLGVADKPTSGVTAPLAVSVPPPTTPQQNRPESTVRRPSEHDDFVAAQAIKRVSPQASGNTLKLLVTSVTIQVQVHIDSQGKVVRADSLSHGGTLIEDLATLSVDAARDWLFVPARRKGRDVESDTVLDFAFDNKGIE